MIPHSEEKRKSKSFEAKRRKGQRNKIRYMMNHILSDSVQTVCFKQLQQPEHTEAWLFAKDTEEVQDE